ncbi:MAG TPA: VOC family protein [Ktedonobacteraceae bacterium]|nr:VOC family protein [Ktedonobacteraceae bacterium]
MLKKIDCVMIRVNDVAAAVNFYSDVFGLKPVWQDENAGQAGLLFEGSDAEIVLHTDPDIPGQVEVYYLVDDVAAAVQKYAEQGCAILTEPFDIRTGKCAVIQDPFGTRLRIMDMSKQRAAAETF